ncbi:MAG TPA: ribosome biogenesis GTPase Der [Thermoanaerobaculia bacterium]|nr:ribosome biogenesis GTPase Der [Thermoanaerobaculia bacterium]
MTREARGDPFRVVVAGRPNVGKSALFNRLVRRRKSIVHDLPGMTRDVLEAEAALPDGRSYRLADTGGYDPEGREKIPAAVRDRAVAAIRRADLVLLVLDASAGVLPGDRAAARVVREARRPCVVAANKIDRREGQEGEVEAWELGFPEVYGVSAEHDVGVDDLQAAIGEHLAASGKAGGQAPEPAGHDEIALAVVGRPNVGKSSLLNALLGEERAIVSEVAGTTRDSVDALLEAGGRRFRLVDTAGIRRRGRTERGPEVLSVVQARKRIEECDVALLVVDASEGPTGQDAAIAGYAAEEGKGLVLVANKWDLAGRREEGTADDFRRALASQIPFARHAPILLVSAKSGRGVSRVLPTAAAVAENRERRIATGELNRVLGRALRDKAPRAASGRTLKVFYVAQTATSPPTFALVASRAEPLHFSEERRVENLVREAADFAGAPIRIRVRERSGRREPKDRSRTKFSRRKGGSR